jgi:hypothetical protein
MRRTSAEFMNISARNVTSANLPWPLFSKEGLDFWSETSPFDKGGPEGDLGARLESLNVNL